MEENAAEDVNVIDYVLGDETPAEQNHSPEGSTGTEPKGNESRETVPECDPEAEIEHSAEDFHDDSTEEKRETGTGTANNGFEAKRAETPEANEPDKSDELRKELETLQKRLHDTQEAMHKATTERAELQKELQKLKSKEADDDDWFSEEED